MPKYLDGGGVHPRTSATSLNPRLSSQLRCSPSGTGTTVASEGETLARERSGKTSDRYRAGRGALVS